MAQVKIMKHARELFKLAELRADRARNVDWAIEWLADAVLSAQRGDMDAVREDLARIARRIEWAAGIDNNDRS